MFSLKSDFHLASFNVRGLRDNMKRKALFLFCKNKKAHCIMLQETHSSEDDEKFWSSQWGDKILFCHGSNRSAGTAILFHNSPGKVVLHKTCANGHWIICVLTIDDLFVIVANIYGHNNLSKNKELLFEISIVLTELKRTYSTDNIILGGDFNMVKDDWMDRYPSKFQNHHYNPTLSHFCNSFGLFDPWRELYPDLSQYSWFKPDGTSKSRIDFWLISCHIKENVSSCVISPAPMSDHCLIGLNLFSVIVKRRNKGYWKFNANLLTSETFCQAINAIITQVNDDCSLNSYISKWEYLKFKVRNFSISFGKQMKKTSYLEEINLIREISECCNNNQAEDSDRAKLFLLQSKLDKIYTEKAKGVYIRSRANWIEAGERNSAYFCRLEKSRQQKNNVHSLIIDGSESTNSNDIAQSIFRFYSNLYKSKFSKINADTFFESIIHFIPKIHEEFKEICDAKISVEELEKALRCLSPDKSPGSDGLTANFFFFSGIP